MSLYFIKQHTMKKYGAVAYRGGGLGGSNPPLNSEDIGGVLKRMSKKTGVSISFCSSLCSHTVVIY